MYDSIWKQNLAALEPYWEQVFGILGDTATVLPLIGAGNDGAPNATSFTTRRRTSSGLEAVFNWQATDGGPSNWTNGNDYSSVGRWQGIVPYVNFDGVNDEADSDDADDWSFVTTAHSFGCWFRLPSLPGANSILLAKVDQTTSAQDAEWEFKVNSSNQIELAFYDTSSAPNNWAMFRPGATTLAVGRWYFAVVTSNATQTAATDINVYLDGVADNGSGTKQASFSAMEAGGTVVSLGYREEASGSPGGLFTGDIAGGPFGLFSVGKELTATEVKRLYNLGRGAMELA